MNSTEKRLVGKKTNQSFLLKNFYIFLFFLTILGIDSFNLLTNQLYLVFQLLNLAIHLVDERIAFLGRGIQEAQIVLVGLHFSFQLLILAHQSGTLVVKGILASSSHLFEVVFELG